mmetsp:Transcript_14171/g.36723  ORF Transcript_14171/g.36723 Transcript_14171/m.36723 type:complete len:240 (+) Transcript_14171:1292-2011(+)
MASLPGGVQSGSNSTHSPPAKRPLATIGGSWPCATASSTSSRCVASSRAEHDDSAAAAWMRVRSAGAPPGWRRCHTSARKTAPQATGQEKWPSRLMWHASTLATQLPASGRAHSSPSAVSNRRRCEEGALVRVRNAGRAWALLDAPARGWASSQTMVSQVCRRPLIQSMVRRMRDASSCRLSCATPCRMSMPMRERWRNSLYSSRKKWSSSDVVHVSRRTGSMKSSSAALRHRSMRYSR